MATENDVQATGNAYHWRIENVSRCWSLQQYEPICSPCFTADKLENTKWTLRLYPLGEEMEHGADIFLHREGSCSGPDAIIVSYQYKFLNKNGTIWRDKTLFNAVFCKCKIPRFSNVVKLERLFFTDRKTILPEDILIIECSIWSTKEKPEKFNHTFVTTVLKVKRRSFFRVVDKISTRDVVIGNRFKDKLIDFDFSLHNVLNCLSIDITALDKRVLRISLDIFVLDSEGKRKILDTIIHPAVDLRNEESLLRLLYKKLRKEKSGCWSNDIHSINFEFVLSTIEHFNSIKNIGKLEKGIDAIEKSQSPSVVELIDSYKSMYIQEIVSDIELRTPTKSFRTHKCILSARSPVFKNMFSYDMAETISGHVDITDFENDTIKRMLLYTYTNSLEDLQIQSATKLYKIADKYQILSLKSRCSSFLKENLIAINACDALILAVLHSDDDLKNYVQDYIVEQRKDIFFSEDWKELMRIYPDIASDTMYRKITRNKMYLPKRITNR